MSAPDFKKMALDALQFTIRPKDGSPSRKLEPPDYLVELFATALRSAYAAGQRDMRERAAEAASMVFGGKTTKWGSENFAMYQMQDHAVERCVHAIRALPIEGEGK